ncbi:MAG TPA: DUF4139 domain-containing protein [Terriglobia bacterium]|nr:DUF4139 domain-containing protein [Terriglobia bacterium]
MLIRRQCAQVMVATVAAALAAASVALAQTKLTSTESDQQSLSLTVYNSNTALVRDVRSVRLPAGNLELQFTDVASQIEPVTVRIVSLTAPRQLTVLEQNYRYDLLDPQKLFKYFVGKQVTLVRHVTENNSTKEVLTKATLLSDNNGPVWQVGDQIVTGISADRFVFPALPPGLYSKPTLVWLLENRNAGEQKLEADYMTKAVNWNADYVLTLPVEEAAADLSSWVTVSNSSGVNFRNTRLQLVAGQVHQAVQNIMPMAGRMMAMEAKAAAPGFSEEALSEYHLYSVERPVTLPNDSSKQIAFVHASGINVQKTYQITGQQFYFYSPYQGGEPAKQPVEAHLKFKNSEGNSLGVPLPAGTVRVYQADSNGSVQFVGEDSISHTPKGEDLNLYIGNAFDVTAERKQTDFQNLGRDVYESAFQITIRNHKKGAVTVDVNEPVNGTWTVLQSNYKYEKTSAFSIRFRVPVEADGQSVLNYRIRVHR